MAMPTPTQELMALWRILSNSDLYGKYNKLKEYERPAMVALCALILAGHAQKDLEVLTATVKKEDGKEAFVIFIDHLSTHKALWDSVTGYHIKTIAYTRVSLCCFSAHTQSPVQRGFRTGTKHTVLGFLVFATVSRMRMKQLMTQLAADFDNKNPDTRPDLCLVLGTRLHVTPFAWFPNLVSAKHCRRFFVNTDVSCVRPQVMSPYAAGFGGFPSGDGLGTTVRVGNRDVGTTVDWWSRKSKFARRQWLIEMDCDAFCEALSTHDMPGLTNAADE
jgi:hypothetical protein